MLAASRTYLPVLPAAVTPWAVSEQEYDYDVNSFTTFGLNEYDVLARRLSPNNLFTQPDPLATNHFNIYCGADPINNIDPTGLDYWRTTYNDLIIKFFYAWQRGDNVFDFSGWEHLTDVEFLSSLVYDDQSGTIYSTCAKVENNEIVVVSQRYSTNIKPALSSKGLGYSGAFVYEPITNRVQLFFHYIEGTTYFDGFHHWAVNSDGRLTTIMPLLGYPPNISKGIGGTVRMGRSIGKMSRNHLVQNKQVKDLARIHKLSKDEVQILHREIGHEGMGYHEIEALYMNYLGNNRINMTIEDAAQILTQIVGHKTTYSETGGGRGSVLLQIFDNNCSIWGWGSYWEIQRRGILVTNSNDDVTPIIGAMAQGAIKMENKRLIGFTIYDDYALELYYEDDYTLCFFTSDAPQIDDEFKMEYWEFINHNTKEVYFVDENQYFQQGEYQ